MKPKNLEYSLKDISVPSKSSYLKSMMNKDENFIKAIQSYEYIVSLMEDKMQVPITLLLY